ncbi:MAG: tetratricopeptide (TPR) repeat protein [Nonlabens sp.]|jgi:tetratricopeptide (TPR) repeat protein
MSGFDKLNNFWDELKKRNVVRALIFYAVTAWLIIQFAATTFPYLNIPKGAITIVIVVLLIGLPIVLIVSWIYEMTTDGLRKTDDVSGEKSITLKTGKKLNRLTTVVLSLAVIFLLVDKFYLNVPTGTEVERTESIAVFPFSVQGASVQVMKEGMVDLISDKLNHIPGMNATDPNILISTVNSRNIDSRNPEQAGALAKELGANRAILGSLTEVGDQLYLKISKYDNEGIQLGQTISEQGTSGELMSQVDNIIRRLVAEELEEQGSEMNSEAVLTTNKLESIVPFLQGIQLSRQGKHKEALIAFKESLEADSNFVLGYYRYVENANWIPDFIIGPSYLEEYAPFFQRLEMLSKDLLGKNGEVIRASLAYLNSDINSERDFRRLLNKYGESLEVLNGLSESIFHHRGIVAGDKSDAKVYLDRLRELDPNKDEYLRHLLDIAESQDDLEAFNEYAQMINRESDQQYGMEFRKLMLQDSVSNDEIITLSKVLRPNFDFLSRQKINLFKGLELGSRVMAVNDEFRVLEGWIGRARGAIGGQHEVIFQQDFDFYKQYNTLTIPFLYFLGQSVFIEIPLLNKYAEELIPMVEASMRAAKAQSPGGVFPEVEYLLGLLHLFNGNDEESFKYLQGIKNHFDDETVTEFGKAKDQARLLYYNFAGIRDYMLGNREGAMENFELAVSQVKGVGLGYAGSLGVIRNLHLAEYYIEDMEYEKALKTYLSLLDVPRAGLDLGANWGFNVYRIAQMYDKLERKDEAIGYYNKFLEAFQQADEIYQPWVDDAFNRLSVLVDRPEAELRGKIN